MQKEDKIAVKPVGIWYVIAAFTFLWYPFVAWVFMGAWARMLGRAIPATIFHLLLVLYSSFSFLAIVVVVYAKRRGGLIFALLNVLSLVFGLFLLWLSLQNLRFIGS